MRLNLHDTAEVRRGRKRPAYIFEGEEKTSSKKWCSYRPHEGMNVKSSNGRSVMFPTQVFPAPKGMVDGYGSIINSIREEVIEFVQSGAADIRKNGCACSLLQLVIAKTNLIEMVQLLVDDVDINVVNRYNQTAAHLAALLGKTEILRILLAKKNFDPSIKDIWSNTYKDVLPAPLFTSVLWSDIKHIEELLELGANPDGHAGKFSEGTLARELGVKTPRELAIALKNVTIIQKFSQYDSLKTSDTTEDPQRISSLEPQIPSTTRKGLMTVFNYKSFQGHKEMMYEAAGKDANNLGKVFSQRGFNGDIYTSLSAEDTIRALKELRDMEMLKDAEMLIFYFSSFAVSKDGVEDSFITSDMKILRVNSVLNLFKESQCPPHLKDKPKLFIFDLCKHPGLNNEEVEYLNEKEDVGQMHYSTRSRGLTQTTCYYSSIEEDGAHDFKVDGSPFNKTFCNFLSNKAKDVSFSYLFKKLKKRLSAKNVSSNSYYISTGDSSNVTL